MVQEKGQSKRGERWRRERCPDSPINTLAALLLTRVEGKLNRRGGRKKDHKEERQEGWMSQQGRAWMEATDGALEEFQGASELLGADLEKRSFVIQHGRNTPSWIRALQELVF